MPIPILMPALSPTMEEGTLSKWLVQEGDSVAPGDMIAEIETDKATMEVEAVDEGTIGKILIGEGTEHVAVNKPIAVLLEEGEGEDALAGFDPEGAAESKVEPSSQQDEQPGEQPEAPARAQAGSQSEPSQPAPGSERDAGQAAAAPSQPSPEPEQREPAGQQAPPPQPEAKPETREAPKSNGQDGRIFASPLARRIAGENNIDISAIAGSGPHGRIVKSDVEKALSAGESAAPAAEAEKAAETTSTGELMVARSQSVGGVEPMPDDEIFALYEKGTYEVVPHDNMRRIIASRLTQAKTTIPHFYLDVDCRIDALIAARKRLNAMSDEEGPSVFKISVNDLVIKAMAMALQKVSAANATWTEQGILRHRSSDIGVAVAVEGGLFTPVIRHAEVKSLSEIANEMKDLAERARARRLKPHEYQGGTTAISNLGMYGIKSFDAVINPPHATILAVGAAEKRPVIKDDDSIEAATMMSCTLSCDHRVVDGALGAELLQAFKGFIEEPVTMLV